MANAAPFAPAAPHIASGRANVNASTSFHSAVSSFPASWSPQNVLRK